MTDAPTIARSGLSGLGRALPPDKARLAARLVATGRSPTPFLFEQKGLRLSAPEQQALQQWLDVGLCTRVLEQVRARDGTVKLLLGLGDGRKVETVAMPIGACCVSTQVGCAVGCRFCASGLFGVERHLTADEIVEQVVHCRRIVRIDRVVFMGMGEPSHNLDAVLEAVARLKDEVLISPRRQTLSTVGSVSSFAPAHAMCGTASPAVCRCNSATASRASAPISTASTCTRRRAWRPGVAIGWST